jgi:hypothetical protein
LRRSRWELSFYPHLDGVLGRLNDRVFVAEILNIIVICHVLGPVSVIHTSSGKKLRRRRLGPGLGGGCFGFGALLLRTVGNVPVPRQVKATRYERQGGKNND